MVLLIVACVAACRCVQHTAGGTCSESECGPRVSKCMLLKACNCSITRHNIINNNCSCCTQCIQCLDKQYTQCCACVGLCNPDREAPHINSYVDKFEQDDEDIIVFDKVALVNKVGTTVSFPALHAHPPSSYNAESAKMMQKVYAGVNCTVVYLDKCMSHKQCSRQCLILGASMLRWFHTGCCECIGHTCLPYGSTVARCKYCTEYDETVASTRQTEL